MVGAFRRAAYDSLHMALIPHTFLDSVVAIGYGDAVERRYLATGFLYGKRVGSKKPVYTVALVTNRHVLEGESSIWLRFNRKGGDPVQDFEVPLLGDDGVPVWSTDPEIDLAVVAIRADQMEEARIEYHAFRSDRDVLTLASAEAAGLSEGDGLFVLGFPLELVSEHRNYVVVRQGVVARIRDTFHGSSREFLADVNVFPGNSGGPVVTRPEVLALTGTKAVARPALIGVVSAYLPYADTAISVQTQRPVVTFEENSGLAVVVPIDHAIRLFDQNLEEWKRRGVATEGVPAE